MTELHGYSIHMALKCGAPPENYGEKVVYDSLGRQLDNSWMIASSCRYTSNENVGVVDRELDLFLAHLASYLHY